MAVMKVVIIVIVLTIGNKNELVTPTSKSLFAATKANSPPEEDKPKPVLKAVTVFRPYNLDARNTVKNFADMEILTKTNAGTHRFFQINTLDLLFYRNPILSFLQLLLPKNFFGPASSRT